MNRSQLEHAIRTSCQIIGHQEVVVVGSQSILGSLSERDLPLQATLSMEVDILPIAETPEQTEDLSDIIEGVAGEGSPFEQLHGFYIDGVGLDTCALPSGWRDRLVRVQNINTAAVSGHPMFTGWCLDKEDLCVAKLYANRDKDLAFVHALIEAKLVDTSLIIERIETLDGDAEVIKRASDWIRAVSGSDDTDPKSRSPLPIPARPALTRANATAGRCGVLLRNGKPCMRLAGHGNTGHRSQP